MAFAEWVAARGGLELGSLLVSFQRFPPSTDVILTAPTSLGALPVARDRGSADFLLGLGEEEGFWIGILDSGTSCPTVEVRAHLAEEGLRAVASVTSSPAVVLGVPCREGYRVFARSTVSSLRVTASNQSALVEIVDPLEFSRRSGAPPPEPLDPSAGYRGWRLP